MLGDSCRWHDAARVRRGAEEAARACRHGQPLFNGAWKPRWRAHQGRGGDSALPCRPWPPVARPRWAIVEMGQALGLAPNRKGYVLLFSDN
jgi:hypothetical protein